MNERVPNQDSQSSWLDKLNDFLLREPKDKQQLMKLLRDAEQRQIG